MFSHFPELVVICVIALIFFGPEKVPEVARNAGRVMREVREALDSAMNPHEEESHEDFSSYYYESLARSGEDVPEHDPGDLYEEHVDDFEEEEGAMPPQATDGPISPLPSDAVSDERVARPLDPSG